MRPGTYSVAVEQQWPAAAKAPVGKLDVRCVLRRDRRELIDGIVLGPDGAPVPRGTVGIARKEDGPYTRRASATILGGTFRIARPEGLPGPFAITVAVAAISLR